MPTQLGYSRLQILLHWAIAALVIYQLSFGESMTALVDGRDKGEIVASADAIQALVHYWIGISILVLVLARIILRLTTGAPPASGSQATRILARSAHFAFYILLVVVPATGLLAYYGWDALGDVHSWAKPVFIVLILVHAGAALVHQFLLRDGTLERMFRVTR